MATKNWKATTNSAKYAMEQAENNNFLGSMWGGLRTVGTALYDTAGNLLWRGDKDTSKSTTKASTLKDIDKAYPVSTVNNATKLISNSTGSTSSGGSGGSSGYSSSYSAGTPEAAITDSLSQMLDAYNQAAESTKSSAKSAYDQRLTNLNEALKQAQQLYDIGVRNANTAYETGVRNANTTYDTGVRDTTSAYENKRTDLLDSLKRFQEENSRNVANQKKAYLSNQAALESAREQADRQNRISAAARGLGGSGLQQLAQVQNLLSQSQDISDLATENQSVMDKLSTALANYEADTNKDIKRAEEIRDTALADLLTNRDTKLADLLTTKTDTVADLLTSLGNAQSAKNIGESEALTNYENTLKEIDAALAQNKANANWDYGTTLSNILLRNSSSGGSGSSVDPYISVVNGKVRSALNTFKDAYNSAKNTKGRQAAIDNAKATLNSYFDDYGDSYSAISNAYDYIDKQKAKV